jgi:mRNA interferase MazF
MAFLPNAARGDSSRRFRSSNIRRIYPFQVRLPAAATGMRQDSKAHAEQIRSVAVERMREHVGLVPAAIMLQIDEALRLHLALQANRSEIRRSVSDACRMLASNPHSMHSACYNSHRGDALANKEHAR